MNNENECNDLTVEEELDRYKRWLEDKNIRYDELKIKYDELKIKYDELKSKSIKQLTQEIHENAVNHGWWEEERSFGDIIALMHSELSEALEEYRSGLAPQETYYSCSKKYKIGVTTPFMCEGCSYRKPEGIPSELADVVIRIMDYCGRVGINLEKAVIEKHKYNKNRPYKHGGKII